MKKVYVISDKWNNLDWITERMDPKHQVEAITVTDPEDTIKKCSDANALLIGYEKITEEVMDSLKNLEIVQFMAIGVEGINLAYAKDKGIAVGNVPTYCLNEVADHTLALVLALNRRIVQYNADVQKNNWDITLFNDISRLGLKTVGLLGFGNIPREVNKRLQAFGSRVIAYDPYLPSDFGKQHNVELVDMETLTAESDYICCHLPLTKGTEKMLNADFFDSCKDGVVFVNTSRGKVVDEKALLDALNSGKVAYAGLDVLETEYPELENYPLNHRDDVILTPHVAYYSLDSEKDLLTLAGLNISNYFNYGPDEATIVNR